MKNLHAFLFAFVFSLTARSMVVSSDAVQTQLDSAVVVAEIEILSSETSGPRAEEFQSLSTARVDKILSTKEDGGWLPSVGDTVEISGWGGEKNGIGMMLPGLARPQLGKRYRAYLKRMNERFEITGFESGLVALDPERQFSRNRTDGSNGEGAGAFLYWDKFPVPYFVAASSLLNLGEFTRAIDKSFQTWKAVGDILVDFIAVGCSSSQRNENDGTNNVILMTQEWPFDPAAIAITRNFYISGGSNKAGLILDSDILLNAVHHSFTMTNELGKHDLQNIVTHEVGHFLGLGHEVTPMNSDATMFAMASPNETKKRALHTTDLAGIRSAYGGVGLKSSHSTATLDSCDLNRATVSCLAVHHDSSLPPWEAWIYLGVLGLALGIGRIIVTRHKTQS